MDKFFFSEKNIDRQCGYLEKELKINSTPELRIKCKKFLLYNMKEVYKQVGNKKPPDMSARVLKNPLKIMN
jgi:site-specific DNA-cytosine methylase